MEGRGYAGQTLWVNLSTGAINARETDVSILRQFLGGRGVGIRLLMELAPKGVDPLAPENPMILAAGPYTGIGVLSAFFNVTTKAPLTGLAASSHCGGYWGTELKRAGFDGIVVTGASPEPCYLLVEEGKATLKPAARLWGRGVFETGERIREEEGEVELLSIGPAGENLVKFAAMMNHHRAAGRSGVGAVMGSKKLKSIAVRGKLPIRSFDPEAVMEISRTGGRLSLQAGANFAKYGSSMAFNLYNEKHALPTRNFREGYFPEAHKIDAEALKSGYFVEKSGCAKCPLRCGNVHRVPDGPYKLDGVEGPEYETMMAFGSNCGNSNVESILMANYLCNDLGMDTITCGDIFALLMDLQEMGIVGPDDLDGHSLTWGDHASMISLIPKIARREGIGNLLAEGAYRAAGKWGDVAMSRVIHAKKQEYSGYESRRSFGTGFSLVTSNRGADHLRAGLYVNEIFNGEFQEKGFEAHMGTMLEKEHLMAIADAFLTCKFGMRHAQFTWPVLTRLINALTGFDMTEADLKRVGERIFNLERLYNLREGVEEDMPPSRFFKEDLTDGLEGGERITMERFLNARSMYYTRRGWNEKGVPSTAKLKELDLDTLRFPPA
jgi:aldehyde:ferredoxin oxidoreductase